MNTKLTKLLLSVCIGLSLIIAAEWLYTRYRQHRLLSSNDSEKLSDYKADQLPEIELTGQTEENYTDLVARPLFIKGRKPVDEPVPETAQTQAAAILNNFDWQLTGVYSTKDTVSALFGRVKTKVPKDNNRRIQLGGDLDGWKLTEINMDKVILKQGSNEKELPLRKPKPKTPPQANNATPTIPAPFTIPPPAPGSGSVPPGPVPTTTPEPAPALDIPEDIIEDTTEYSPEEQQQ